MKILLLLLALTITALADPVTLAWDKNPEPDVVEYRLRVGVASGVYGAPISVLAATEKALDLPRDVMHYAVVTAVNTSHLESVPSAELVFRVGGPPPQAPGNLRLKASLAITLQTSPDLQTWTDRETLTSQSLFFRLIAQETK